MFATYVCAVLVMLGRSNICHTSDERCTQGKSEAVQDTLTSYQHILPALSRGKLVAMYRLYAIAFVLVQ